MHDFLSSTKKKNTIDTYFQKNEQNSTALITPQKEKMQATFKIESGQVKGENSTKPSDIDIASVTKTVSSKSCVSF